VVLRGSGHLNAGPKTQMVDLTKKSRGCTNKECSSTFTVFEFSTSRDSACVQAIAPDRCLWKRGEATVPVMFVLGRVRGWGEPIPAVATAGRVAPVNSHAKRPCHVLYCRPIFENVLWPDKHVRVHDASGQSRETP